MNDLVVSRNLLALTQSRPKYKSCLLRRHSRLGTHFYIGRCLTHNAIRCTLARGTAAYVVAKRTRSPGVSTHGSGKDASRRCNAKKIPTALQTSPGVFRRQQRVERAKKHRPV
ncbi:hypothetical protein LSAT2_007895 [Lamellibrachia satsuma]|nr:hypothetical protein LSAT2_007895 [Lamellibrachia satsuma]